MTGPNQLQFGLWETDTSLQILPEPSQIMSLIISKFFRIYFCLQLSRQAL